jgi:glutathione synthase/RimK-type ligase-like ATP-grasp enzyme
MKIHFMIVRRVPPVPSPVLLEVYGILRSRGFEVEAEIAEENLLTSETLAVRSDLYVVKSHTELSLSLAGVLHAQGAFMLNPYLSCTGTQDKIVATHRLRAAGIPVPATWVTADLSFLRTIVDTTPLIIKPHRGHRGAGIYIVRNPRELAAVPPPLSPVVAQEFLPGTGEDLKVYVIGDQVFAVRKQFSEDSFAQPGRPTKVSSEVRRIALACGEALGLGLYGIDLIESPDGPVVVDLNYFPGYKGVPNTGPMIADYIHGYATGHIKMEPPNLAISPNEPAVATTSTG